MFYIFLQSIMTKLLLDSIWNNTIVQINLGYDMNTFTEKSNSTLHGNIKVFHCDRDNYISKENYETFHLCINTI